MEEVENAEGGAPVAEETAAPEVAETAPAPKVEAAPAPEAPAAGMDRYESLVKSLGEIPDKPNEQLLESIDEQSIAKLPDSAKGLLKHMMAQQKEAHQKQVDEMETQRKTLGEHEGRIREEARNLLRRRAQLNKMLMDPKFQELLTKADVPEDQLADRLTQADVPEDRLADPLTQEGMQQRIQKGVAEAMREFQKPITAAATRAQQMEDYTSFVETHSQMKEAGFKKSVRAFMESRRDAGTAVSLEDAYAHVDRQRLLREEASRVASEREARAKSARKISRSTVSGQPDAGDPVPEWVTKKGYNGVRGNSARIQYLRDHPKALEKLRAQQRQRR